MSVLKVLAYPDPRLRQVASFVSLFDKPLSRFVDDLFETMYAEEGVGLAATQVGDMRRVLVVDCGLEEPQPMVLINPEIMNRDGVTAFAEGCLSVPGLRAEIERAQVIEVRFQDRTGVFQSLEARGLLSVCIQHEIDHLDGIMYFDHLPPFERKAFLDEYRSTAEDCPS